jgi:hypothetical protein|tara:strand:- start:217 stop:333 length:117 start_codon:yes stop_codon:yes gene_type:complete
MHPLIKILVAALIIVLLYFVVDAKFKHMTAKWTVDEQK